jgi:hypothetical protein
LIAIITTTGCGGGGGSPLAQSGALGEPCASPADCAPGLYCYISYPGGNCTVGCGGAEFKCPDDGVCIMNIDFCVKKCTTSADCRPGWTCLEQGVCYARPIAVDLAMRDFETPDMAPMSMDANPGDLAAADLSPAQGDMAQEDLAIPDLGNSDLTGQPDVAALLDLALADFTVGPDLATPDLATPDLAMPDLATPDLVTRDLRVVDLTQSPDLAVGDCLSLFNSSKVAFAGQVNALQTGDFDGNGQLDVAVGYGQSFSVKLGDGKGGLGGDLTASACTGNQETVDDVAPGDLDGDGKLDLVIGCNTVPQATLPHFQIFKGKGDGTFAAGVDTSIAGGTGYTNVGAGDWNGDGKLDVMAVTHLMGSDVAFFYPGQGDGTLGVGVKYSTGGQMERYRVAALDWNGDKKLDLTLGSTVLGMTLVAGNGDGTFAKKFYQSLAGGPAFASGDLNEDGLLDFVAPVPNANSARIIPITNGGNNAFTAQAPVDAFGVKSITDVGVLDADRDGHLDVAAPNVIWRGDGKGNFDVGWTCTNAGKYLVVGDFNGDGKADVLVDGGTMLIAK